MTIYDTSLDLFFAQLWVDFLLHASSTTSGVPAEADVPIEAMDIGKDPDFPSLVVAAKEDSSKGAKRTISITFMLLTWLKSQEEGAADIAEQTPRDVASQWIGAVDRRIRQMEDGELEGSPVIGFKTWLASLPPERLAGWRIMKLAFGGLAPVQRNEKMRTIFYGCTLDAHVALIRA